MVQVIMTFLKLLLLVLVSALTVSAFDVMMVIGSYQHFTYGRGVYCQHFTYVAWVYIVKLVQVYLKFRRAGADTKFSVVKVTLQ